MAFSRFVFTLLVLSVVSHAIEVPVYMWGDLPISSRKSNPLSQTTAVEFGSLLHEELKDDPFTVIFIEKTLSVEDISTKINGKTAYPYLHENLKKSLYLPSVETPVDVISNVANPEKVDNVELTEDGLSAEIKPDVDFLFINLNDAKDDESRFELLSRHNDFMQETVDKLKSHYNNIIAIYTAENPSWFVAESHSRVRRQSETQSSAQNLVLPNLLLYVENLILNEGDKQTVLNAATSTSSTVNNTEIAATLTYGDNTLTLNFNNEAGYWFFKSVNLTQTSTGVKEELTPSNELFAFEDFSYRCGEDITFTTVNETKTYSVVFQNMKVQPFFESGNASSLEFGDSLNCVGFFSESIWAGLFVVFILLAITFFGIMMMMDIKTMDRFDDPKGKTITINAASE